MEVTYMPKSHKCKGCKKVFPDERMTAFANSPDLYCPYCYKEKAERLIFQNFVQMLFGLKSPGPRIWAERKRIRTKWGLTDEDIVRTLDYVYNVRGHKKVSESIYMVNPLMVDEARAYYKDVGYKNFALARAAEQMKYLQDKCVGMMDTVSRKEKKLIDMDELLKEEE